MKLNKKDIEELRKDIEERLSKVPDDQKVCLDKELLEELLFETIILGKKGYILKIPVWSGEFLRKIDLSQVDFSNVSWGILDSSYTIVNDLDKYGSNCSKKIDKIRTNFFNKNKCLKIPYQVDYSETNANIDLMQSFEARHYNKISINNCNFLGLDFSKQSLSKTYEPGSIQAYTSCINSISIFDSNLTATGLFIPKSTVVEARCSLLNGINLSEKDIDMKEYLDAYKTGDPSGYSCCSLCYTGINFLIRPKSITDFNRDKYISAIKNNQFIGCYINGKKFSLPIEKKEIAERIKKAYLDMKSEKFASVDEQFKPYEKALKKTK